MKHYFIVSLCKNGILGGGITADAEAITYHTGKLTVPAQYRHLEMKYRDIRTLTSDRLLLLPTVTVTMTDGAEYKFIVFARKRFLALLREMGAAHEA